MKRRSAAVGPAILMLAACLFLGAAGPARPSGTDLSPVHRKWLEDDVDGILSSRERDVFLRLDSDRERDLFIAAFWKRRDPVPATPENEFKAEHERRLAYADAHFGRTAARPGRKTGRGRMYVLLGEPDDIVRYSGKDGIREAEVWFYRNEENARTAGLPPSFNLVFYQEGSVGDFKIYSPFQDGPAALLSDFRGDPGDYEKARRALSALDAGLAAVSVSLIPGEASGFPGRPSPSSDILLQKIAASGAGRIDDEYAAKFLEYKDIIEVEYSANYLDSRGTMIVRREPSGTAFVHYAIEPARLSLAAAGREYAATLRLNGAVSLEDGRIIYAFEKIVSVRMDEERKNTLSRVPFMIQDLFPLIPGTFKVSLLLKNEASKEFCAFERTVVVPESGSGPGLTAPLLGHRVRPSGPEPSALKPFLFGSTQVYFQSGPTLVRSDNVVLAFQVLGLDGPARSRARLRFSITRDDVVVEEWERDLSGVPDVVESIPASGLNPAFYTARVRLVIDGREAAAGGGDFAVTPLEAVPRPWIHAKRMPADGDPAYDGLLGRQLEAAGRAAEARPFLEKAVAGRTAGPEIALALARVYDRAGEYAAAAFILDPYLAAGAEPVYDVWILAAETRLRGGDFGGAVGVLDGAMTRFGIHPRLLNLIGDGYLGLNRRAEARAAWERSLALNPGQPELRKKLEALAASPAGGGAH
ncbi:MAG: GWxTD domain-containing protein [Acidobacteriota bacterium]|nr:GWxTD domain-containing protein [Acidobacteriota bacterium]OQB54952.1 MAG: hypothetical protein BWX98_02187 [Candidatus Aminicenantes bacterium ADurb.Bin147]HOU49138.1 GWxTD domain-containing protein [Candidatus Aminicenantes bacterium]MDD8039042.1 GWxTD domain-containing protein [Acidobacteriota bacterium]MDW3227569.1 GWxTD domain-containing protein [Acidobacteriota bacterium]